MSEPRTPNPIPLVILLGGLYVLFADPELQLPNLTPARPDVPSVRAIAEPSPEMQAMVAGASGMAGQNPVAAQDVADWFCAMGRHLEAGHFSSMAQLRAVNGTARDALLTPEGKARFETIRTASESALGRAMGVSTEDGFSNVAITPEMQRRGAEAFRALAWAVLQPKPITPANNEAAFYVAIGSWCALGGLLAFSVVP